MQGVGKKIFSGVGGKQRKKQDWKVAPLSLPLLYQYHVWKSRGVTAPLPSTADAPVYIPGLQVWKRSSFFEGPAFSANQSF